MIIASNRAPMEKLTMTRSIRRLIATAVLVVATAGVIAVPAVSHVAIGSQIGGPLVQFHSLSR
jgi:hypothetical protein